MPESTPVPNEHTVVVQRPGTLTYISLAFNAVILLMILIAIASNHHRKNEDHGDGRMGHHEWADRDGDRNEHGGPDRMRQEWRHEDFSARGGECPMFGPGGDRQDPAMAEDQGWDSNHCGGEMDGPGWGGGPGFGGMPKTPPNSEEMTDRFMLMLTPKLSLTDDETAQIRPIIQGGIQQFQKDMETQKQAHQKMIDDAKTKIRATLTPDQQKQFDTLTAGLGGAPTPAPAPVH
jgi:hypothetical protein